MLAFATVIGMTFFAAAVTAGKARLRLDLESFRIVSSESGPVNYFRRVQTAEGAFIRASYEPPLKTAVLGYEIPEPYRKGANTLSWRWRARGWPRGATVGVTQKRDSAAVVYVTWRRGLRWYSLKYVWSSSLPKGTVCEKKRNLFRAQDTIVLESGGPLNRWKAVKLDAQAEFRRHFEEGDPSASVPPLVGIGLMSDGDQTHSRSSADYADFVIGR
jgi:hypothetical protein